MSRRWRGTRFVVPLHHLTCSEFPSFYDATCGEKSAALPGRRRCQTVSGTCSRADKHAGSKFAIAKTSQESTLVPWHPVIDRRLGREVSGIFPGCLDLPGAGLKVGY
ncbi:DUF3363 domain-containing protein [Agrobacterium larrymoorei]|uniref:DUF3363 domain-containing protein n=1 Tax=Agrobacterium larrymoorei TaxID=160699 RepID=UPI0027D7FC0D|nr:DUF3363 domain-containing protein [Agrobacterium larrymoorei]